MDNYALSHFAEILLMAVLTGVAIVRAGFNKILGTEIDMKEAFEIFLSSPGGFIITVLIVIVLTSFLSIIASF